MGLVKLPTPFSRLALRPPPACPAVDFVTANAWAAGARVAVAEAVGGAGDSILTDVRATGELTIDLRGCANLESGLESVGWRTSEVRRLAEVVTDRVFNGWIATSGF